MCAINCVKMNQRESLTLQKKNLRNVMCLVSICLPTQAYIPVILYGETTSTSNLDQFSVTDLCLPTSLFSNNGSTDTLSLGLPWPAPLSQVTVSVSLHGRTKYIESHIAVSNLE